MEKTEPPDCNFDGGFNTLICQDDDEHSSSHQFNQDGQRVQMFRVTPGRRCRLAAVILALLAALLLAVDVGLAVHYNKLTDTQNPLDETEKIGKKLVQLQDKYKAAIKTINDAKKQLDSEKSRQREPNWEFEHQNKRNKEYEVQMEKLTKDVATLKSHLPMIHGGCRHCPPEWILMNSICYYFPFSRQVALKTWQKAREFCQMHGGDLAILNSKDKVNSTVNHLIIQDRSEYLMGFWIGLSDIEEEGTWKWLNGKLLSEGYWNDGEPNDVDGEDCVAVYARENFFKSWNDFRCAVPQKWICEKAPTSMS
ncbi:CD209 antigen-like protein C [Brachyistius frenatus]|uniref:CD209 antigen-like protein C n=1 Tax=Brachyistius frenatus TaxID=100188 RepID=UPI0037E937D3